MRSIKMAQLIAAAVAVGVPLEAFPTPRHVPVRQPTEADADRMAAAKAKRDRKAAKRASQASKQGE